MPVTKSLQHRSHFGSRYKTGCCGHAGLLLFGPRFEPRRRGEGSTPPFRSEIKTSSPNSRSHWGAGGCHPTSFGMRLRRLPRDPHATVRRSHVRDKLNCVRKPALVLESKGAQAGSTLRSSGAVPDPSTNRILRRFTAEVGRDPVHSTRYGRQR